MSQGALPGFRDFYPEQLATRNYLMSVWRDVARKYGFVEYDGPPLEPLDLYTRKSGDEIVGQLYTFTDKGGREVALRPEMTPTLARMVAAKANAMRKPIRWFSVPQLFRYERQQKGRLREHFQLNVDIVGEASIAADAELLAVAIALREEPRRDSRIIRHVIRSILLERVIRRVGRIWTHVRIVHPAGHWCPRTGPGDLIAANPGCRGRACAVRERSVIRGLDFPPPRLAQAVDAEDEQAKRGGGRRYYRPEDVALLRRIRGLLYTDGYTIKGVQRLLRESAAKASEQRAQTATPSLVPAPEPAVRGISGGEKQELRAVLSELQALRALLRDRGI